MNLFIATGSLRRASFPRLAPRPVAALTRALLLFPGESRSVRNLRVENGGELPGCTGLGGYPLCYLTGWNNVLCPSCANDVEKSSGDPVRAYDVHWEGAPLTCDDCGGLIESAYGDPDADEVSA